MGLPNKKCEGTSYGESRQHCYDLKNLSRQYISTSAGAELLAKVLSGAPGTATSKRLGPGLRTQTATARATRTLRGAVGTVGGAAVTQGGRKPAAVSGRCSPQEQLDAPSEGAAHQTRGFIEIHGTATRTFCRAKNGALPRRNQSCSDRQNALPALLEPAGKNTGRRT